MLQGLIVPTTVFLLAAVSVAPAAPIADRTTEPQGVETYGARLVPGGPRGMLFSTVTVSRAKTGSRS